MVEITLDGAASFHARLLNYSGKIDRVLVRALNRSIASARTAMVREAAGDTGLKSRVVREAMILREATLARPEASLSASPKRIPRIDFDARGPEPSRGKGRGVSYLGLGGGRVRAEHAFIATMPTGHRGVFERNAKAPRLGIHELKGPSLWYVFSKFRDVGVARAREAMVTNLAHELNFANNDQYADIRAGLGLDA